MSALLVSLTGVRLTFGGAALFEGADLSIEDGARIALVGRNGSGKSTLLKIAAGIVEPDAGERYKNPGATIAYLPQEPDLSGYSSLRAYVEAGLDSAARTHDAERALVDFGLDPDRATTPLSGGEAKRASLARAFASDPDVILLDEPTNHLDLPAIEHLEQRLAGSRAAVVLISHDRRFLETLSTRTVWVDRGRTRNLDRGFKDFEAWRDKVLEDEETAAHKLDRKIVAEEHWVRYGVTARRKRNMRRMRELDDLRRERRDRRRVAGAVNFAVEEAAVSGKRAIKAEKVAKSFGDRVIIRDFSIEIARGDRVGFVGPNGAGKTTLLSILTGALAPDAGAATLGANVEIAALDQKRAALNDHATVADAITDGRGDWVTIGGEKRHVATYLRDYLFGAEQWRSPVSALSGGERARLALAGILAKPSNLLVLDEPTNDLDLETLDLLEELVAGYQGTVLVVSHDRSFLDRVATSIVAPDASGREGQWTEYVGGYSDMLAQRGAAPTKKPVAKAAAASTTATAAAPPKAKLSFKEKFALEQLPGRMTALETEIAGLKAALDDPALFARDGKAFAEKATKLAAAEAALAAAEEEWLALELKREDLSERSC